MLKGDGFGAHSEARGSRLGRQIACGPTAMERRFGVEKPAEASPTAYLGGSPEKVGRGPMTDAEGRLTAGLKAGGAGSGKKVGPAEG